MTDKLIDRRYGKQGLPAPHDWNQTLETLLSHKSIRAYLADPLPTGPIEQLVVAAQSASSSSNLQTWSVVAVEDVERKAKLAALANNQAHILQAPVLLVWLADLARLSRVAERQGLPHEGLDYLESFLTAAINEYDAIMNEFYTSHNLSNPGSWSEHSSQRIATRESLSGRDRLLEVLKTLGFPLK